MDDEAIVVPASQFNLFFVTLTAWVRTTQNTTAYTGIAGNYPPAGASGYSIALRNGRVEAWYYASSSDYTWIGSGGLDGGFIADGDWHHLAFVVDETSSRLYVDASLVRTRAWTGQPGPCASTDSFRIGHFATNTDGFFAGQIDQVSVWAGALTTTQIQDLWHFVPFGTESTLWAGWSFNETNGASLKTLGPAVDSTSAYLDGDPLRVVSTAPIGPAPVAITAEPMNVTGGNATLRAKLNPLGLSATAWFEWGPPTNYGFATPATLAGNGTNLIVYSAALSGLAANTTFQFRVVVTNQFGRLVGRNLSFNSSTPFDLGADLADGQLGTPAWGDFDNDGDLDLLVRGRVHYVNDGGILSPLADVLIFRNDGAEFAEVTVRPDQSFVFMTPSWVDFDRDGDLDIFVPDRDGSRIYRNDGGTFTPIDVGLPPFSQGTALWCDFDNDGDADLIVAEQNATGVRLFQNDGGWMKDIRPAMPQISNTGFGSLAWADYDGDGDMDLVTTGFEAGGPGGGSRTHLWRNSFGTLSDLGANVPDIENGTASWGDWNSDGQPDLFLSGLDYPDPNEYLTAFLENAGGGQFVPSVQGLPALVDSASDWGDYNADGQQDLLYGGSYRGTSLTLARLYRNTAGIFGDIGLNLPDVVNPAFAWGDFDQDGRLDFVIGGGDSMIPIRIYRNRLAANSAPTTPTGLTTTVLGRRINFAWNPASDAETPAAALSYNLRVGTAPGAGNVLSADADTATGRRHLTGPGNAQFGTNHFLILPPGTYYWSVQTVDGGYAASGFAIEQSFTVAAPVETDCGPLTALEFDGVDDYVEISHSAALNPYPMTIAAWVKTAQVSANATGIASKYNDGSANGYSIALINGRVRAWYFRDGTGYVWDGGLGLDGGFVADGLWHHLAFTVDANGGKLYVDGALRTNLAWTLTTGLPGPPSTTTPLLIGRYLTGGSGRFAGQIDEVTLWNTALLGDEINALLPRRLTGAEAGLVGDWSFNQGSGSTAIDGTSHGYTGTLFNSPAWVASGAPICAPHPRTLPVQFSETWANGALVHGVVTPQGFATTAWFEYGLTTAYGSMTVPMDLGNGDTSLVVSNLLSGLMQANPYHFRVVATNRYGRVNGLDQLFTTRIAFQAESSIPTAPLENVDVTLADITGDGLLDFVQSGYLGAFPRAYGYRGSLQGDNRFPDWVGFPPLANGAVAPGDFDNDGDVDLFVCGYLTNSSMALLWQNRMTNAADSWIMSNMVHSVIPLYESAAAWGDFDNDGDLDLAVSGKGDDLARYCRVYRNDGGVLTDVAADLTGVSRGALAWGDFDNDGDLDLLVTGTTNGVTSGSLCRIYRNDGGTFVELAAGFPGYLLSSVAWGDYDGDGLLDFAVGGLTPSGERTTIYHNDGGGSFTDIAAALPGSSYGALAWGDYDNDGFLDLLLSGSPDGSDFASFTRIYRQSLAVNTRVFTDANVGLPGLLSCAVAWGDYNNDGALDIALAGRAGETGIPLTRFYRGASVPNHLPSAPEQLKATVTSNFVTLSWNSASDAETSVAGLTYNLRVGTSPGGSQIMSAHANPTNGERRLVAMGNVQHGTNAWLRLGPGTYYWSAQTIDGAFAGSPFATEGTFAVAGDHPRITFSSIPTSGQFFLRFAGRPEILYQMQNSSNLIFWSDLGPATEVSPGQYQFLDPGAIPSTRFYRVRQP